MGKRSNWRFAYEIFVIFAHSSSPINNILQYTICCINERDKLETRIYSSMLKISKS